MLQELDLCPLINPFMAFYDRLFMSGHNFEETFEIFFRNFDVEFISFHLNFMNQQIVLGDDSIKNSCEVIIL